MRDKVLEESIVRGLSLGLVCSVVSSAVKRISGGNIVAVAVSAGVLAVLANAVWLKKNK